MLKDAKKISDAIAGSTARDEMRVTKYFNSEIIGKKDEILLNVKTKSFFPGRQVIILSGLPEKDYKVVTEIDSEWQNHDAVSIVIMNDLSKNSEFKRLLDNSDRMAVINYAEQKLDSDFLTTKLVNEGINVGSKQFLTALTEFSNFTSKDILEKELEKLILFKLYDGTPMEMEDFFNLISINYEVNELDFAVALAEKNLVEIEKKIIAFFSSSKSPTSILQFVFAYFNKLSLMKLYGPNSFEAKREYPFLVFRDFEKAKSHADIWTTEQLKIVANCLTVSDLKLRKYPSLFHRSILNQCVHKIMEI